MGNNYSGIDHLLNLQNKEMGHMGSSMAINDEKDKKIAEKNFSEVNGFKHDEKLFNYIKAIPDEPKVPEDLKNMGVKAVSNPAFPDHTPISDNQPSPIQDQILAQINKVKTDKDPENAVSWLQRVILRNLLKNNKT